MNLLNDFLEQEFKIIVYKNKINIINYIDINSISDDEIYLTYKEGLLKIKGDKLAINKMIDHEILISGKIKEVKLI